MLFIIISIVLLVLLVGVFAWSKSTTPGNLSGYYGFRYFLIGLVAFVAILVLCTCGIFNLINL